MHQKVNDLSTGLHNTGYYMGDLGQVTQRLSLIFLILSARLIIELLDRINKSIKITSEC